MTDPVLDANATALEAERFRMVRYVAAGLAGATAFVYLLIGLKVVTVIEPDTGQPVFGILAALGWSLGVVLLLVIERRWVWVVGAVLQAFTILMYFNLASERTPAYEEWGIVIRVLQVVLLVVLVYLAIRAPQGERRLSWRRRT